MNKIILGFVGEIASGKGTSAAYLMEKYGANDHRFSAPLRDVLNRISIDTTRENLQNLSSCLRQTFGQNLLAHIITEDAKKDEHKIVIIDGIRRNPDIEYLEKLPEFKLIYITADPKLRFERLLGRGQNSDDKTKTYDQFLKDHEAEAEKDIPTVSANADYKIINDGELDSLHNKLDEMLKHYGF